MIIEDSKRIVVKVGSALLINDNDRLHKAWLQSFAEDISRLRKRGHEVLIVSSGSIALGKHFLDIANHKNMKLEEKQAAAACGQPMLIEAYRKAFDIHEISTAQILVDIMDSDNRRRYLNARATVETLLNLGIIPIIKQAERAMPT